MRHLSAPLDSICQPVPPRAPMLRATTGAMDAVIAGAAQLLAETGYTLLLIERSVREGGTAIRIDAVAADGSRIKGIARSGDPAMRALCQAANAVLRQLAEVAPDPVHGDRTGLMTDGTGVLFSPERPSVTGDDWLGAVLAGEVTAVDIVPFDPCGCWHRLAAVQHEGEAH